jgi:WD40 repeat protein
MRVWDARDGTQIGSADVEGYSSISFVELAQVGGVSRIIYGGWDGTLHMWEPVSGHRLDDPLVDEWTIQTIALGHIDGFACAISGGSDGSVRIWDPTSGRQVGPTLIAHDGSIQAVAFGEIKGTTCIASGGGRDPTVRIWEPSTLEEGPYPVLDFFASVAALHVAANDRLYVATGSALIAVELNETPDVVALRGSRY